MALNDNYDGFGCIIVANIVEKKNNNARCYVQVGTVIPERKPEDYHGQDNERCTSVIFR